MMCVDTPRPIAIRISRTIRFGTTKATESPMVIHSRAMVIALILGGVPFPWT
jgi:hypothetical protein